MKEHYACWAAAVLASTILGCRTADLNLSSRDATTPVVGVYEGFDTLACGYLRLRLDPSGNGLVTAYSIYDMTELARDRRSKPRSTPFLQQFPVMWTSDWTFGTRKLQEGELAVWPVALGDWPIQQDELRCLLRTRQARWRNEENERVFLVEGDLCGLPVALYRSECLDDMRKTTAEAHTRHFGKSVCGTTKPMLVADTSWKHDKDSPLTAEDICGVYEGWGDAVLCGFRLEIRQGGTASLTNVFPPFLDAKTAEATHENLVWSIHGGTLELHFAEEGRDESGGIEVGRIIRGEWGDDLAMDVKGLYLTNLEYPIQWMRLFRPKFLDWIRSKTAISAVYKEAEQAPRPVPSETAADGVL